MSNSGGTPKELEECFKFEIWTLTGIDVGQLDDFILECDRLTDDERVQLTEERKQAFYAYANGNFELAIARTEAAFRLSKYLDLYTQAAPKARAGMKHAKTQKERAALSRTDPDVVRILGTLAAIDAPYKDLWNQFSGMLDERLMDPAEQEANGNLSMTYTNQAGRRTSMSYGTFKNRIGELKKSR